MTYIYNMRGYLPASGSFEHWQTGNPHSPPPSGNSLLDVTITSKVDDSIDPEAVYEIKDDFDATQTASGGVGGEAALGTGSPGWFTAQVTSAGSYSTLREAGHPGIVRLTSSTSANTGVRLYRGYSGWAAAAATNTDNVFLFDDIAVIEWVTRNVDNSNSFFRMALANSINIRWGFEFFYDTNISASLQLNVNNDFGGSGTQNQQLVTVPTQNTWNRYRVIVNRTSVRFYINDLQVGNTVTSSIPTGVLLTPYVLMGTRTSASRSFDIDKFHLRSHPLSRR